MPLMQPEKYVTDFWANNNTNISSSQYDTLSKATQPLLPHNSALLVTTIAEKHIAKQKY